MMTGNNIHEKALFDRLLVAQEQMSEALYELILDGSRPTEHPACR